MREFERGRHVARQAEDVFLGKGSFPRDAGAEAVGTEVHREIDVLAALGDRPDADDVGVLELGGGLALVAKTGLELGVARVAGLQHLNGHRGAVRLPADERPREAPLAEQAFEGVRSEGPADEIGGSIGHGRTLQRGVSRLTYGASND